MERKLKSTIEAYLSSHTGESLEIEQIKPVRGGDINDAFQVTYGSADFFVKLNSADKLAMFEAEARGLKVISDTQSIKVPHVIGYGQASSGAFLILEFINVNGRGNMEDLAKALAKLHRHSSKAFGFSHDNFIGSTAQPNGWNDNWLAFLAEQRFGYQLNLLAQRGASQSLLKPGRQLINNLDAYFQGYSVKPALLHGDLWQGNYGFGDGGEPVIYDPACYFGDHEADLAMMELFGRPGEAFFATYHQYFPIHEGYAVRKQLYNLYHILNHANLFGGGYAAQAQTMLESLLAY